MARQLKPWELEPPHGTTELPGNLPGDADLPPLPRPVNWPPSTPPEQPRLTAEPEPIQSADKHGAGRRRQGIVPRKKHGA